LNPLGCDEIHLLLDSRGALVAYQETDTAWAGLLAFSSEELARRFCRDSALEAAELVAISVKDEASVAAMLKELKRRAVRFMLLDLDYRSGKCVRVEFEGAGFGATREYQFEPRRRA
jgi:hypothetical protein